MKIIKQYVFVCTAASDMCLNCINCSGRTITIKADSKAEAIEQFKKIGGKIDYEKDRIVPPSIYCSLSVW